MRSVIGIDVMANDDILIACSTAAQSMWQAYALFQLLLYYLEQLQPMIYIGVGIPKKHIL